MATVHSVKTVEAGFLGIKELKEALVGVNELAIFIAMRLKDGIGLDDAMAIWSKLSSDEEFKQKMGKDLVELYVHCFTDRGRTHFHVPNYEPPLENFIDVDTTNDKEFDSIQKIREKLGL